MIIVYVNNNLECGNWLLYREKWALILLFNGWCYEVGCSDQSILCWGIKPWRNAANGLITPSYHVEQNWATVHAMKMNLAKEITSCASTSTKILMCHIHCSKEESAAQQLLSRITFLVQKQPAKMPEELHMLFWSKLRKTMLTKEYVITPLQTFLQECKAMQSIEVTRLIDFIGY